MYKIIQDILNMIYDILNLQHTTVWENCDGKRKEWWARNQLTADYELLCRDGTRAPARDYKRCYLGKVQKFELSKINMLLNASK